MAGKYGTSFLESEAILAADSKDVEELARILARMTYWERNVLQESCRRLDRAIEEFDHATLMGALEQGWITQAEFDECLGNMLEGGI